MKFIGAIKNAIKEINDIEKLSIFCFTILIIFFLFFLDNPYKITLILYSFGMITLAIYFDVHKISILKTHNDTNPEKCSRDYLQEYDFKSILTKRHPFNLIRKLSIFFFVIGTLYLFVELFLEINKFK